MISEKNHYHCHNKCPLLISIPIEPDTIMDATKYCYRCDLNGSYFPRDKWSGKYTAYRIPKCIDLDPKISKETKDYQNLLNTYHVREKDII